MTEDDTFSALKKVHFNEITRILHNEYEGTNMGYSQWCSYRDNILLPEYGWTWAEFSTAFCNGRYDC